MSEHMSDPFADPFMPLTDDETADFFDPAKNGFYESPQRDELNRDDNEPPDVHVDYDALVNAPDFSTLIKGRRGAVAKEYENKVRSVLKSGALGSLKSGNLPDSAAIFRHGPAFAAAVGSLAEVSERTRSMVDLATAPENPYVALLIAGLPLAAQLYRNRQPAIQEIQRSRREMRKWRKEHPEEFAAQQPKREDKRKNVEIRLPFGRRVSFRVGLRFNPLAGVSFAIKTQTREPGELVMMVFSDQKLVAALKRQGIDIVQTPV